MIILESVLIAITSALVSSDPVYDFEYKSTTEYGVTETFSGTEFYELDFPQIFLGASYCVGKTHCGTAQLDTGYKSEKQSKTPQIIWKPQLVWPIGQGTFFDFIPTIVIGGRIDITSCKDSIGREFHCYHGTQPNSRFYLHSFEEIEALHNEEMLRVTNLEVRFRWEF